MTEISHITFLDDIVRELELRRSKTDKISFRSMQLRFSDDITERSYGAIELAHFTILKNLHQKVARDAKWDQSLKWSALHA